MSEKSHNELLQAVQSESLKFKEFYLWLELNMPPVFFQEVSNEKIILITHSLMGLDVQEYYSDIHLRNAAIILLLDSADADLRVLKNYSFYGIKNYQAYISKGAAPFQGITANLRIAVIYFTEAIETVEKPFPIESREELRGLVKARNPELTDEEFNKLIAGMNNRYLRSQPLERLVLALDLFFRAKAKDNCQYEVEYNENWETNHSASLWIVLAWRNVPKYNFLYRLAKVIHRHGLVMKRVNATYLDPYSKKSILLLSLGLHGSYGQAAWEAADIPDFLRELVTVKYFASFDIIDEKLVGTKLISGNLGNFFRAAVNFIHQALVHVDANLYSIEHIEEDICRHPELTTQLCQAFELKFNPDKHNYPAYLAAREKFLADVSELDTGQVEIDNRRRNVLVQAMNFIHHTLKTNFYRKNLTSLSFRMDPSYLDHIPFDRLKKFPELPYAIFYTKGMHFIGFHIRFKDLARGGLRTVYPDQPEQAAAEMNNIFTECYNLAYTQHKKNKDIPEAGAKGIIFLKPFERLESEALVLEKELQVSKIDEIEIQHKMDLFRREQKQEFLYQAQRSFIESLVTIVNCDPDGTLRAKHIVDYWKRPEYLYLGPDENMHDSMIQWIAEFSKKYNYKPGSSFISGKPKVGINHKEYGVTSLGLNVYLEAILNYLGIDPGKDPFTLKMSGGPDGDVAGNEIVNLHHLYPKTAKLLALTDVSGTINDPLGLDLSLLVQLFKQGKPIRYYPPEKLNEGGFLLDKHSQRNPTPYVTQTLCWRKQQGKVVEDWISGNDMNALLRNNVHQTKVDIFIPSGGRPRTLNQNNIHEFLDETGKPTARAIVEGANLYLTPPARRFLEELGVLVIKDSSANKTGVICSSFEVLSGLTLGDERFMENKNQLVKEILERLKKCAKNEADLLLRTHDQTGDYLTDISEKISEKIINLTYVLLDYLDTITLSKDLNDPLVQCFLNYCLPTLREKYSKELLSEIPEHHKKAIIASHLSAQLIYRRGLDWSPSIIDILPVILEQQKLL